jgi:putative oxidoreductase
MQALNKLHNDDFGKLVLRLTVGGLMLFHGIGKLKGVDMIGNMLEAHNLPAFLKYGVYLGELVAPVLLIVGYFTRPAAIVLMINMIVAIALAHRDDVLSLNEYGIWKLELHGFYFFGALAILFLGAGKYSASRGAGTWD